MILEEATLLLTAPPGNLAYHLILAFALAMLFSLAHLALQRDPADRLAARWRLSAAILLSLRLLFLFLAGLAWIGALEGRLLLPPFDRFASALTPAVALWALLGPGEGRRERLGLLLTIVLAGLGAGATVLGLTVTPPEVPFNRTLADLVWGLAGLLLAAGGAAALTYRRAREWPLGAAALALLALGFGLHLTQGQPEASLAGHVRLMELMVVPLLAVAGMRLLIAEPEEVEVAPGTEGSASARQAPLTDIRQVAARAFELMDADTPEDLACQAVQAVAEAMRAEFCLLLGPPTESGEVVLATGYDLIREEPIEGRSLNAGGLPVLNAALSRHRSLSLPARSQAPDLETLRVSLGLDKAGAALLAPVLDNGRLHGGLLLLSPFARRRWSREDRSALEQLAEALGRQFSRLMHSQPGPPPDEEATRAMEEELERLRQENASLAQELAQLTADDASAQQDLGTLLTMHEEAQQTIEALEQEIERLRAAQAQGQEQQEELDRLAKELQLALRELAETRARLAQLETAASNGQPAGTSPDLEAIASIAQELRQPMSSILGYTDLLLGESVGLLGAMQRKFLERVRSGIERMGVLLNDLIQVAAIESGRLTLTPGPVDLMRCIEQAVTQASGTLREKNQALRMDVPDEIPPVLGDEDAVTQIVLHLLENAIGATPEGGEVVLSARVREAEGKAFLFLSVTDAGEGIPPEDLGRVFQRVYRADNALIQGVGDHGVGLSLVRTLTEAMGGRVWVESEVGTGSTFTVLLPLADGRQGAAETAEQQA